MKDLPCPGCWWKNRFPPELDCVVICVPLLLIFFVAFVVRVFEDVFQAKKKLPDTRDTDGEPREFDFEETRLEKLFSTLGRLNIYSLGATVIVAAFLYWMVPDLLVYIGKISFHTLAQLKWVLLVLVLVGGIYIIVRAVLSYKTKIAIIVQQSDIQKTGTGWPSRPVRTPGCWKTGRGTVEPAH